uniref:Secretogranin-3 n=1 Tax=Gasterosteus aculeatus aculeatus TaxID=481459 RepID=A0AAQ4PNW1_GASAC
MCEKFQLVTQEIKDCLKVLHYYIFVADKTVYNRELTEERPLQDQRLAASKDTESEQDLHDLTVLKSLADGQKSKGTSEGPPEKEDQYVPDESDSTKSRRLAEDYDSTKNRMDDGKYQDDPESFRQIDGTPLTAEDIVQKIANKIYEEDDRGVFDRIVLKLLKLGLITDSQADTLEYQVAEALQDLITKNARDNEIEDVDSNGQETNGEEDRGSDADKDENNDEDEDEVEEVDRDAEEEGGDTAAKTWDKDTQDGNEVSPEDGLQDLQYFPNFYRLLRSLDSDQDAQERETLITIMKTLIDFVKMMVKYGTITPEEGVSYLENLDAMIAMQTKNKLGKALGLPDFTGPNDLDEEDNTKAEAAKMQKEYENLKDSTKEEQQPTTETNYDLSKLKDFMDQQVDAYIQKGIMAKDEGETIKRIYSSL